MNYYEHHIGDYAEATSHLSFVEDAAYSRLIRKYYATEKPLPRELAAIERLIGARSDEERAAVKIVLEEFFTLTDEGWRNKRCDEDLARYHEKRSKARRSANARWHAEPSHSERNANASKTDANAMLSSPQSPDTSHQTQEGETRARDGMRTQCERIDPVSRGTLDAGDALTRTPSAEDALAEVLNAWRDVERCDHQAMTAWLAHWSRVHANREMPGHQRIATAKLLAGLGDADTQRRAVATAEAAGWKALRHGDGRAPPRDPKADAAAARAESERIEWQNLEERAERVGFRKRVQADDLIGYRCLIERAERNQPRGSGGAPVALKALLGDAA